MFVLMSSGLPGFVRSKGHFDLLPIDADTYSAVDFIAWCLVPCSRSNVLKSGV